MENFHRAKIDTTSVWRKRLQNKIKSRQEQDIPILLPDGIQFQQTFYTSKPLHCFLYTNSSTLESFIAHHGAGPKNGIDTWTRQVDESKLKKFKRSLDCRIKAFVFVSVSYVIFASCDDLSVRLYSSQFREHSKLQLQYSILSLLYEEDINIITGCVGKIQRWKLDTCLHKPPLLLQEAILHDNFSNVTPWLSTLHFFRECKQIIALSGTGVFFIDAFTFVEVKFLENRHSFPLTACIAFSPKQYFITASKSGEIKTWNMSMHSFPYVGSFKGHMKKIISLAIHPIEKLLISASDDSTIRLWRMETFRETYRFDVLDTIVYASLINCRTFVYTSQHSISLLNFNLFHSLFTLIGSKLISINLVNPGFQPSRVLVIAEDGGARIISPVHGNILTMVFPIVTHKPVLYRHDPVTENVYVLLESGDFMVITSKTNPCSVKYIWSDVHQSVVCFDVAFIKKARISVLLTYHTDGVISGFCCLGYSLKKISPNRGLIIMIKVCDQPTKLYDFVTFSLENTVTLYKFAVDIQTKDISINVKGDIQLDGKPDHIALLSNTVAVAFGKRLLFYKCSMLKKKLSVKIYQHTKDESHSAEITHLTSCAILNIFATSAKNGRVKIWGATCDLLREMSFDETLSGVCFLNGRGDLLVGFQYNLHYVNALDYLPNDELEVAYSIMKADERIEYCIPFDPLLKFWYDANRVRTLHALPVDENNEQMCSVDSAVYLDAITAIESSHAFLPQDGVKHLRHSVTVLRPFAKRHTKLKNEDSTKSILQREESILQNDNLVYRHDNLEEKIEKTSAILLETLNHLLVSRQQMKSSSDLNMKTFWPCAADGFIPNSVVRDRVQPKPPTHEVQPWKPRCKVEINNPLFEDFTFEDDDFDRTKTWLSGDDDENDFYFYDEWPDFSTSYSTKKSSEKKTEKKKTKKRKTGDGEDEDEKLKSAMKKESRRSKLKEMVTKQKETRIKSKAVKKEGNRNVSIVEEGTVSSPATESNDESQIPPPYDKYFNENWFPIDVGFHANVVTLSLLSKIPFVPPFSLRDLLQCIVDIHKCESLSEEVFNKVIIALFDLLEHPSGQIRHYAVETLLSLGANKKEVVLKLVPKLGDPVMAVREQVKIALNEMAGIRDADTLVQTLKDYGEYRETELSDDREVIESLRHLIAERGEALRQKLSFLSERDARLSEALGKLNEPSKYNVGRHSIRRTPHGGCQSKHNHFVDNKDRTFYHGNNQMNVGEIGRQLDMSDVVYKQLDSGSQRQPDSGSQQHGGVHGVEHARYSTTIMETDQHSFHLGDDCSYLQTSLLTNDKYVTHDSQMERVIDNNHLAVQNDKPLFTQKNTHDKPLFTQKSKHLYQLNEKLANCTEETAEDALQALAPNMYGRFNNLPADTGVMVETREGLGTDKTTTSDNGGDEVKQDFTQSFNEKLEKLYHESVNSSPIPSDPPTVTSRRLNRYVKSMVLAVAFSTLQARRCNNNDLLHHGILGNETLYHLTMLLNLFQSKKHIKRVKLDEIQTVVTNMKQQFFAKSKKEKNGVNERELIVEHERDDCRQQLVPGVCGERIVSKVYCLRHQNSRSHNKFTQIRSLPERNGNLNVSLKNGSTRYGTMRCDWTTMAPAYICSPTQHRALMKQRSIINQKIFQSKLRNAKTNVANHLRRRLSPLNRLNNTPILEHGKDNCCVNKLPAIPPIIRWSVSDTKVPMQPC